MYFSDINDLGVHLQEVGNGYREYKALKTHVDIEKLAERFNMRSQSIAW